MDNFFLRPEDTWFESLIGHHAILLLAIVVFAVAGVIFFSRLKPSPPSDWDGAKSEINPNYVPGKRDGVNVFSVIVGLGAGVFGFLVIFLLLALIATPEFLSNKDEYNEKVDSYISQSGFEIVEGNIPQTNNSDERTTKIFLKPVGATNLNNMVSCDVLLPEDPSLSLTFACGEAGVPLHKLS